jgi:addiction module RelE/StbE family toxin
MLVKWRPKARLELWNILDYIGDRNPIAAANLFDTIEQTTQALPEHPYLYRLGRVSGTREIVISPNYIVIYRTTTDSIEIISVVHARQEYPQ